MEQSNKPHRIEAAVSGASSAKVTKDGEETKLTGETSCETNRNIMASAEIQLKSGRRGSNFTLNAVEGGLDSETISILPVNVLQLHLLAAKFPYYIQGVYTYHRAHSDKCVFPHHKILLQKNDLGK